MKDAQEIHDTLLNRIKTLHLASTNLLGEPNASYAPFIRDASNNLFIFISGLAKHTQNLLETHQAAVLIIEDEQGCRQLFARHRISYQCVVSEIHKDDQHYNTRLDQMEETFGNTLGLLRGLADFRLLKLQPVSGQIVTGFGQTYPLPCESLTTQT